MFHADIRLADEWRRLRPVIWRSALVVFILASTLWAFASGVDVSDRPGVSHAGLLTRLYYAVGLFVLGGLDLGVPVGGPPLARAMLWLAYFGAPALTGFAVVEGVFRTVAPEHFRLRRIRNHIIVVGGGSVSELYLSRLQDFDWRGPVVLVLAEGENAPAIPKRLALITLHGEIRSQVLLAKLRLDRAQRIVLTLDDGLANLDAAAIILAQESRLGRNIIVHLSDLGLLRAVEGTRIARDCSIFNSHHIAATHLVRSELLEWFQHTEEDDVVVLGGFGRFGQSVLGELQQHASGRFDTVIIVDPDGDSKAELFQHKVGFMTDEYQHHVITANMGSPALWHTLETRFALSTKATAIVLGCGNDGVNLRAALHAADSYPQARILSGVFGSSAFADALAAEKGLRVISVSKLVKESMPAAWFKDSSKGLLARVGRKSSETIGKVLDGPP